jgi:hypothetical protein
MLACWQTGQQHPGDPVSGHVMGAFRPETRKGSVHGKAHAGAEPTRQPQHSAAQRRHCPRATTPVSLNPCCAVGILMTSPLSLSAPASFSLGLGFDRRRASSNQQVCVNQPRHPLHDVPSTDRHLRHRAPVPLRAPSPSHAAAQHRALVIRRPPPWRRAAPLPRAPACRAADEDDRVPGRLLVRAPIWAARAESDRYWGPGPDGIAPLILVHGLYRSQHSVSLMFFQS